MSLNRSSLFVNLGQDLSMMIGIPTIPVWDSMKRPERPKRGTLGFNMKTRNLEYWDGSDWYVAQMEEE